MSGAKKSFLRCRIPILRALKHRGIFLFYDQSKADIDAARQVLPSWMKTIL